MKSLDTITEFLARISDKSHILGIIFYGSCRYKTNNPSSDIDLLLITDEEKNTKGTIYIEDRKVEFFEKNIFSLIEKINQLNYSLDRSLMSIFKNGEILYSKNNTIEFIKEEVLSKIENPSRIKNASSNTNDIVFYKSEIERLESDNPLFLYYYYNLLEVVRQEYHQQYGYSKLPTMKVYDLYSNPDYAKDFYCVDLPKTDFRNKFLHLIKNGYDKDKLDDLLNKISIQEQADSYGFSFYSKNKIIYFSTVVKNAVDKSNYYLECNRPDSLFCYYNALNKTRRLYDNINGIEQQIDLMKADYDSEFLSLLSSHIRKPQSLESLFETVSKPLDIDYKNYKVLELQ